MENFLIAGLTISLIIFIILFLRERSIRKIFKKEILFLEEEKVALKKKNNNFFMAEVRYIRVFRSHKKKIISLSKNNEGLRYHLHNYEEIKIARERQYTNLN